MKILKWFKSGQAIPSNATYIKSENKVVGYRENSHPRFEDVPVLEEFHLYEVSSVKKTKEPPQRSISWAKEQE